jgi:hypothetical protein
MTNGTSALALDLGKKQVITGNESGGNLGGLTTNAWIFFLLMARATTVERRLRFLLLS